MQNAQKIDGPLPFVFSIAKKAKKTPKKSKSKKTDTKVTKIKPKKKTKAEKPKATKTTKRVTKATTEGKSKRGRPRSKANDDLEFGNSGFSEDTPPVKSAGENSKKSDEGSFDLNENLALFAGMSTLDEVLYEDLEYQEDLDNLHPAEIAARYQSSEKGPVGGSDEQILKDLRKLVFSVPLLHQDEVAKLFTQIDSCIFPTVYSILDVSMVYFEEVIQVVIKVAAGNTYGKNIYEKVNEDEMGRPIDPKTVTEAPVKEKSEERGTYKDHELKFLRNSYNLFRLFAEKSTNQNKKSAGIERAMKQCAFIRGVYEDILSDFVNYTKYYESLHWLALKAKFRHDHEEFHRVTELIILLDQKLRLSKSGYYITREAKRIYSKYMELRAMIITPYLRKVYSTARNTASNPHQMLDNFQNGSMGLMRAVSCYSTKRLANFSSVATWWIKQMMLLSIKEDANFVKLPVSTWQAFTQLEKAKNKVGANDEDIETIATAAKMPLKKAKSVYYTVKISQVYSLNRTYDSEEKLTLEDIMTNEDRLGGTVDPFGTILREYCETAKLSETELKILALRHGMVDLIKQKEVDNRESMKEALTQNLAVLGYNFRLRDF